MQNKSKIVLVVIIAIMALGQTGCAALRTKSVRTDREVLAELKKDLNKTLAELSRANKKNKRLHKEIVDMHYNLAVILTKQNNFRAAIREFEKVLEIKPDDKDTHYNLAIIYDEYMKDNKKALEHYRAYLRIAPQDKDSQKVRKWVIDKESELMVSD